MTTERHSDAHSECCMVNGVECLRGLNKKQCPDWKAARPSTRPIISDEERGATQAVIWAVIDAAPYLENEKERIREKVRRLMDCFAPSHVAVTTNTEAGRIPECRWRDPSAAMEGSNKEAGRG